ncbi:MAG: sulfatase-like hydrolase/transferase [Bryobacteraceae bacterium]|nr:sulfatase-like hydrolase/transferase [Bryobacteraceae bacterium]
MSTLTTRRQFLGTASLAAPSIAAPEPSSARPNFVIIFLDDAGYADFHPFARPPYSTPNVARLASEGCRFTNFYVPQAVCSASRSALLSGCFPERTRVFGAHGPRQRGLDPKYATLGNVMQSSGYQTAVFGKWHIGDQDDTRPHARGFSESAGLMYSNDMWEFHPENPKAYSKFPLQYWNDGKVTIERVTPDHQQHLTNWYTTRAVDFIRRNKSNPFLLYVPHSMPHVPLFCSPAFKGRSGKGLYADVMMEIDSSVGRIMGALRQAGVDRNTMVLFTSDNGPWHSYGNHAGKTPFREAKGTSFDGGTRSPCIVRFPGRIQPGTVSSRTWSTVDVLPTIAGLAGASLPSNPVDGRNVWDLVSGKPGALNPHEYYPFTINSNFEGILSGDGRWKLHVPHDYRYLITPGNDGAAGKFGRRRIELSLYDMENDPFETANVMAKYPDVTARLQAIAERHRREFFN